MMKSLREDNQTLAAVTFRLKEESQGLCAELKEEQAAGAALSAEKASLEAKVSELEGSLEDLRIAQKEESERLLKDVERTKGDLAREIKDHKTAVEGLKAELREERSATVALSAEKASLEVKVSELAGSLDEARMACKKESGQLLKEVERTREDLARERKGHAVVVEGLNMELIEERSATVALSAEKASLAAKASDLEGSLEEARMLCKKESGHLLKEVERTREDLARERKGHAAAVEG
ncbi:hypothetical protein ACHAWF_014683, partial [Thalassiosira exigua]